MRFIRQSVNGGSDGWDDRWLSGYELELIFTSIQATH